MKRLTPIRSRPEGLLDASALGLVLGAALLHAGWNLMLHRSEDRVAAMAVAGIAAGILLAPATVIWPPWEVWPSILASGAAEAVYGLALVAAYARGELSFAYPVGRGTAPLLVTLGGWAVLSESPTATMMGGALALGAGLTVLGVAAGRRGSGAAVGFALLTGLAIAVYSVVDASAVRRVDPIGYLGPILILSGLILAATTSFDRPRLKAAAGPGLRIAVGSVAAYLLVLLAFQRSPAGPVATLREVSVLLGIWLSAERPGAWTWVGASLVVTGAILAAV